MKTSFSSTNPEKISADIIAVLLYQDESLLKSSSKELAKRFGTPIIAPIGSNDFKGKEGEMSLIYTSGNSSLRRVLLVGLGKKSGVTTEKFRRASATAAKRCQSLKTESMAICLPQLSKSSEETIAAVTEAALLSLYRFDKYLTKEPDDEGKKVESVTICSFQKGLDTSGKKAVQIGTIIAEATMVARDLSNAPGNEIYPESLAQFTKERGAKSGFKVTVLNEDKIKELGMGGVIGVSQGSVKPPRFMILEYGKKSSKPIVLAGKGVTFDSGGISIKPSSGMGEMKMDMAGAASVIGTFDAVSRLKLPVHIIGLIPAVENMPSGNSIRPGDVLRHLNGKTSEVDNTDAEGRLILADALCYADRYKPKAIIDLATLTGACVVALGHHAAGMMGNDQSTIAKLKKAGEKTYERVWELPLFEEYEKQIKSDIADVKNVGGRWAGAITAALFLKKFVGKNKWVHLDIAGPAIQEELSYYTPKGGSGFGVRLLTEFLRTSAKN